MMKRSSLAWMGFVLLLFPLVVFAGKDPADYPLKVHILQQNWASHNLRYNEHKGTGRGNIKDGDAIHGFDFTYDCTFPLTRTAEKQPLSTNWQEHQHRLARLQEHS